MNDFIIVGCKYKDNNGNLLVSIDATPLYGAWSVDGQLVVHYAFENELGVHVLRTPSDLTRIIE